MARIEHVSDLEDPRLDPYRDVRDPAWLRERGIFLAEGRLAVRTLLAAPRFRARSILATQPALESLADAFDSEGDAMPVYAVSRETLAAVSGVRFHQGCVAVGEQADARSAASLLAALEPGPRLVVVL